MRRDSVRPTNVAVGRRVYFNNGRGRGFFKVVKVNPRSITVVPLRCTCTITREVLEHENGHERIWKDHTTILVTNELADEDPDRGRRGRAIAKYDQTHDMYFLHNTPMFYLRNDDGTGNTITVKTARTVDSTSWP
jgi:hypothetical protein